MNTHRLTLVHLSWALIYTTLEQRQWDQPRVYEQMKMPHPGSLTLLGKMKQCQVAYNISLSSMITSPQEETNYIKTSPFLRIVYRLISLTAGNFTKEDSG